MITFYFSGQRTFGNRGCEAIVRSTVSLLREHFGADTKILVPSDDILRDQQQWPEAAVHGVSFVRAFSPWYRRYWVHLQRLPIPALKRAGWPFPLPIWLQNQIKSADVVFAIGGDNYSLDYRLPSLYMGVDEFAQKIGKPTILWGASVGPFEREPHFVPVIRDHLIKMTLIAVRESISYEYLIKNLSLNNVIQMVDPAFTLSKESVNTSPFWPKAKANGVIGLNISSLIERYKQNSQNIRGEVSRFVHEVVAKGFGVLLVPHVVQLDGSETNNDAIYMKGLLAEFKMLRNAVSVMPAYYNASQIKQVISQLRFFIGARTHATIAALSSGVPTISIAYSIKAKGINQDLFGEMPVILPTPELTVHSLMSKLNYLIANEKEIKEHLAKQLPLWNGKISKAIKEIRTKIENV